MRRLEIRPTIFRFSFSRVTILEIESSARSSTPAGPVISRRHFVVFRDSIFNLHVNIRKPFGCASPIWLAPAGAGGRPRRLVRSMIHKIRREIRIRNSWILLIHNSSK